MSNNKDSYTCAYDTDLLANDLVEENEQLSSTLATLEEEYYQLQRQLQVAQRINSENYYLRAFINVWDEEKLHYKIAESQIVTKLTKLRQEYEYLQNQIAAFDREHKKFLEQYNESNHKRSNLASIYLTASLHHLLDRHELQAIANEMILSDLKRRHFHLTSLFVTSFRLYETLDRQEILNAIQEVIINLVGSEQLGIFELGEDNSSLTLASSYGMELSCNQTLSLDTYPIGWSVRNGEFYLAEDHQEHAISLEEELTACIPLKVVGQVLGAIVIFRLLPQKVYLEENDRELLRLLSTHAAMALYCSRIHAREARKI